ncbi:MAG: hypothetical protein WBQ73_02850, partial [Candidatus Babeliales bacterium]
YKLLIVDIVGRRGGAATMNFNFPDKDLWTEEWMCLINDCALDEIMYYNKGCFLYEKMKRMMHLIIDSDTTLSDLNIKNCVGSNNVRLPILSVDNHYNLPKPLDCNVLSYGDKKYCYDIQRLVYGYIRRLHNKNEMESTLQSITLHIAAYFGFYYSAISIFLNNKTKDDIDKNNQFAHRIRWAVNV